MADDKRTVGELTIVELTEMFEVKGREIATTFATTKIQKAVHVGCYECLRDFGFDIDNPQECVKNQVYLTRARLSSEKVNTAVKVGIVGAVLTVVVGAITKLYHAVLG